MPAQASASLPFWDGTGLPMSRCKQFRSTNADTVRSYMGSLFCDHTLRTEGGMPPMSFRHHRTRLNGITFHATDYGMPYGRVMIDIPVISDICLVQFSISGTAAMSAGGKTFEMPPGHMCVLNSETPVRQVFDHDYKHVTVKIPIRQIESVLHKELGFRELNLELQPTPIKLDGAASGFAHMVRTICDDIDSGLSAYHHRRAVETVEDTLTRLLLAVVPHSYSDLYNAPAHGPAPYYVKRVEQYIYESRDHDGAITLADMVEVSGVSARSLHAGFRRFRDTTPMAYLKQCRLDRARRKLKTGVDDGTTVTEIAMACGFTHLSKFARDYQERFGELPSATLKQFEPHPTARS
ncbi:AraC family transcriptional regulator [Parasphingopyxis algicola]|uniref:AraC family transcriptional regulator n=1 Tax=Parasphingopyxis algicola TaxID=2026624 RepID=UPI0015A4B8F5|nr:AraC family transcriptional regulator [Parasphingopyxis algicola]QLC25061.1 AraC family transcriptional regulator [Parasphingopyxis algicola]